jgi:hypothetical protein
MSSDSQSLSSKSNLRLQTKDLVDVLKMRHDEKKHQSVTSNQSFSSYVAAA